MNELAVPRPFFIRVTPGARSDDPSPRRRRPRRPGARGPRRPRGSARGPVIAVLLFHLGFPWAAGGFVGVDAFFVLSGFLITGLIIREHERTGRISLPAFYARRVRRILPAALVTIVVTVGVAAFVLAPLDLPEITLDGAAAALSVGNIRFAIEATDYFGPTTPSPFRHFWSLGVEEQFYLLWPALMVLAMARGGSRRRVALVIGGVVAASFAASFWLTGVDQAWAFYSFPTRAWQLGLGGLLAATAGWFARRSGLLLGPIALAGVVGLVGAVVFIDGSMPYPGLLGLLPAVATAAVVVGGDRRGPARWLLSLAPLRWFGRISYSLYLWHWPFLVLPVLALGRELALDERLALAGISIAVATASWRWIEEPFRRGWSPTISRPRTVLAGVGAMALTAALAVGVGEGVVARLDAMASETVFVSEAGGVRDGARRAVRGGRGIEGWGDEAIGAPDARARPRVCRHARRGRRVARRPADVGAGGGGIADLDACRDLRGASRGTDRAACRFSRRGPASHARPPAPARRRRALRSRRRARIRSRSCATSAASRSAGASRRSASTGRRTRRSRWRSSATRTRPTGSRPSSAWPTSAAGAWSRSPSTRAPSSTCGSTPRGSSASTPNARRGGRTW